MLHFWFDSKVNVLVNLPGTFDGTKRLSGKVSPAHSKRCVSLYKTPCVYCAGCSCLGPGAPNLGVYSVEGSAFRGSGLLGVSLRVGDVCESTSFDFWRRVNNRLLFWIRFLINKRGIYYPAVYARIDKVARKIRATISLRISMLAEWVLKLLSNLTAGWSPRLSCNLVTSLPDIK